jgi:hypothetical protein
VAWERFALDETYDAAVPVVQLGTGRAIQFARYLDGAIKVPRVAPVATASAPRSSAGGIVSTLLGIGAAIVGGVAIYQWWKHEQRSADVRHGAKSENALADRLEETWGGTVDVSPGSRGPADLDARLPIGRFLIQVKSSRRGVARWPRTHEIEGLTQRASRERAGAVVALVSRTTATYHDARTREPIDL